MSKSKTYKEQEQVRQKAGEPIATYASNKIGVGIAGRERDDIRCAISAEELLNRLRPRIKALFK